ncbi:MAG: ATP synthase F0 subunit B [Puniceicoccales bacterium]|jgi:F-type H+-transporting ATPase subunit b|nr:ATP synthase F0 subunit B [Puniceicoccales bacterium]
MIFGLESLLAAAQGIWATIRAIGSAIGAVASRFHVEWSLLFAQMFNFAIVAYVLHRFAFKPLMQAVDERRKKIEESLQKAEEVRRRMAQAETERKAILREAAEKAKSIVELAQSEAENLEERERQRTKSELDALRQREQALIADERESSLLQARSQLKEEAVRLAQKLLKAQVSEDQMVQWTAAVIRSCKAE